MGAREGHIAELRGLIGTRLLIVPSVSVGLWNQHGILLAHHSATGVWSTPGGAIEPGETVSDACRREAREELLVDVEPVAIAAVLGPDEIVYPNGDRTAYVTTVFACHTDTSTRSDGSGPAMRTRCPSPRGSGRGSVFWSVGDSAILRSMPDRGLATRVPVSPI